MRVLALAAAIVAASFPTAAAAQLSPAEQAMVRTVDAEQERTLAMLARWVDQNSGTMNLAGVRAVGDMVRAELAPLGFKVGLGGHERRRTAPGTSSPATPATAAASGCC